MKKILITGASGFVGGFLVDEALKRNYEVFAGVRNTSNRSYLSDPQIKFFESGLSDKQLLKESLKHYKEVNGKFDYLIHNAGVTKTCRKDGFDTINFQYTKNLIEALIETDCVPDKFIYISSLAAYGPGDEKSLKPIKDSDTPRPISLYGKSKLKAEKYIKSVENFPYLIFRPTGVYGPREKDYYLSYKMIAKGFETYIGTSQQHITFIYVKDLTRLLFDSLESAVTRKSYFVTDLKKYTTKEFNTIIKRILNKKTIGIVFPKGIIKIIALISEKLSCVFLAKVPTLNTEKFKEISCINWLCDSNELVKDFAYKPEYNLERGIAESIAWYKKEGLL